MKKIFFLDHHTCHAYYALYEGKFQTKIKDTLVLTADAYGDKKIECISINKNCSLKGLRQEIIFQYRGFINFVL